MRGLRLLCGVCLAGLSLLSAGAAAQQVHVVGPVAGPGVDFTTLSAAVASAADGDIILVEPGAYGGLTTITHRSLSITGLVGAAGERAKLGPVKLVGVGPGQSMSLRAVDINLIGTSSLDVTDCAGPVLLEDVSIASTSLFNSVWVRVAGSSHVMFTRCSVLGAASDGVGLAAPPAVEASNSAVSFYACSLTGGHGKDALFVTGTFPSGSSDGGPALRASNSTVLAAGGTFTGGRGGHGITNLNPPNDCLPPSSGGAGMELVGGLLRELDVTVAGGAAGHMSTCGPAGTPGATLLPSGGATVSVIPETLRTLSISSPVVEGGSCSVEVHGGGGGSVTLLQSLAPLGSFLSGLKGTLAGAPPFEVYVLAPLDGTGSLAFSVGIPTGLLPPGIEGVRFVDQLVDSASGGGGLLSTPSSFVLVQALP